MAKQAVIVGGSILSILLLVLIMFSGVVTAKPDNTRSAIINFIQQSKEKNVEGAILGTIFLNLLLGLLIIIISFLSGWTM